jgi:hypothetical protein
MKKLIAICLVTVLLGTGYTKASTFEITSQQYHIWGQYHTVDFANGELTDSYDITGQEPASGSVWHDNEIYGFSSADLLLVNAGSCAHRRGKFDTARAGAHAEGDWTFSPQIGFNLLKLEVDTGDWFGHGIWSQDPIAMQLEDLTSGTQLFYHSGTAHDFYGEEPFVETFSVDPIHQYHLYAYISSSADADGPWFGSIEITAIPEPSAVFLLGLGCLMLLRRN